MYTRTAYNVVVAEIMSKTVSTVSRLMLITLNP